VFRNILLLMALTICTQFVYASECLFYCDLDDITMLQVCPNEDPQDEEYPLILTTVFEDGLKQTPVKIKHDESDIESGLLPKTRLFDQKNLKRFTIHDGYGGFEPGSTFKGEYTSGTKNKPLICTVQNP